MDGGAWWASVHGVAKSRTRLSDFTFTFHFHALEKEMATHSCVLAWRIPGTAEPGGRLSMGSHRVRHDCSDSAAAAAAFTLLFFPIKEHRRASQVALAIKNPPGNAGDIRGAGLIPGSGRSPGGGRGNPRQYSWASLLAQLVKNLPAMWETWA